MKDEYDIAAESFGVPWISQSDLAKVAKISRVTFWNLPDDQKPPLLRMGGHLMLQVADAADWAREYNAKKQQRGAK